MGLQRRVQRAQAQRLDAARQDAVVAAKRLLEASAHRLTIARLKIAVCHADREAALSANAFRKYPNRATFKSMMRAGRQARRTRYYAQRIVESGSIDLRPYPNSSLYGEFFAPLFGRAHDDTLLFFLEEAHFRKTLRLELRR